MKKARRKRWLPRTTQRAPRAVIPADRRTIIAGLNLRCRADDRGRVSVDALRLRAAILLAAGSGLRVGEVTKLNLRQLLEDPENARWRLASLVYLRPEQAKGRRVGDQQWASSGTIVIGDDARAALRSYVVELKRRGWTSSWPPAADQPLFVAVRRNARSRRPKSQQHGRLAVRTLQYQFRAFQLQCGITTPYHFHDLRHTAMTKCAEVVGGNIRALCDFGRCSAKTATRYLHNFTPEKLAAARNELAFR